MKRIQFIINPSSGKQNLQDRMGILDYTLGINDYEIIKYYTKDRESTIAKVEEAMKDESIDELAVFGGDGTVNEIVQGVYNSGKTKPIAIYPAGTVNDLATYLKMPKDMKEFANMILRGKTQKIDLGLCNDRVFANVAAAGMLTEVAINVPDEAKKNFGRLSYYAEGIREFTDHFFGDRNIAMEIDLKSKEVNYTGKAMLLIISNSASVGGFKNLVPNAHMSDGKLDVLLIKDCEMNELANILLNVLSGNHINMDNVIYFHSDEFEIATKNVKLIDLDGEKGTETPAKFKALNKAVELFKAQ
ncbi:MAG: diacylglycerol kinase family lipid kinase [Tissierellia bacterium]|nr:diacylglycerol kinase family lipid kinase [Tissierellia bacterium]